MRKDLATARIVVNGLGAAGVACVRILLEAGVRHLKGCGRDGLLIDTAHVPVAALKHDLLAHLAPSRAGASLRQALHGADVFIGLSRGNVLTPRDLQGMRRDPIVFAMANPDPEIDPIRGMKLARVFATGRSDLPNQINNALAFPGVFRGALDAHARAINEPMKLAAARAIAGLIKPDQLCPEYIVPSMFDKRVVDAVAKAVGAAARATGVAQTTR